MVGARDHPCTSQGVLGCLVQVRRMGDISIAPCLVRCVASPELSAGVQPGSATSLCEGASTGWQEPQTELSWWHLITLSPGAELPAKLPVARSLLADTLLQCATARVTSVLSLAALAGCRPIACHVAHLSLHRRLSCCHAMDPWGEYARMCWQCLWTCMCSNAEGHALAEPIYCLCTVADDREGPFICQSTFVCADCQ